MNLITNTLRKQLLHSHRNTKCEVETRSAVCTAFFFDAVLVLVLTGHSEDVAVTQYNIDDPYIGQCVK